MNVFYNVDGVGDVLLIQLTTARPQIVTTKKYGDVTAIHDESSGELVAMNLFHASAYMDPGEIAENELSEATLKQIQDVLHKNGATIRLDVDLSPKFVVGYVTKKEKHPNADKLSVCTVDIGEETVQIVCGAPNVDAEQKVVVAKVGAVMPSGMVIRDAELRGVASAGMICSAKELALPNAPEEKGILVLASDAVVGSPFKK